MRGYKTVLELLREDLAAERAAVKTYRDFAARAASEETGSLLLEFAKAEQGHANGLLNIITEIESGEHEVAFYCPVCGWELNFGRGPETGSEIRCRMCGRMFLLEDVNGDFELRYRDGR